MMMVGNRPENDIAFQCADVRKPLLSTAVASDGGFETTLKQDGGKMFHADSKGVIPICRRDTVYYVKMLVKLAAGDTGDPEPGFPWPE